MKKKFDLLVFIGRFQPFHAGHQKVIEKALTLSEKVTVLVGSSFQPRNIRNPFSYWERKEMIEETFSKEKGRIVVSPIMDYPYDDNKWIAAVQNAVYGSVGYTPHPVKIGLIGHAKDHTSYYLNLFPDWESVDVPQAETAFTEPEQIAKQWYREPKQIVIDGTTLRHGIFDEEIWGISPVHWRLMVSAETNAVISKVVVEKDFSEFLLDYKMINQYKEQWSKSPYPPTFVTVDSIVTKSGNVLLVKRGARPGLGQWAIPGGFLEQNERIVSGALRELKEETKIDVPIPVLHGNIRNSQVFDHPHRSSRGRTITHAFHIDLDQHAKHGLPKVKGSDDAQSARWIPFGKIDPTTMFEDHYHILDYFLNFSKVSGQHFLTKSE